MIIEKNQSEVSNFITPTYYYNDARSAMKDLFAVLMKEKNVKVLFLPAYIGVSPIEGSGIYDPVCELEEQGLTVFFYKITENLDIDIKHAVSLVDKYGKDTFIFLRVNYFGFIDKNASYLYRYVKEHGGVTVGDNAHGFFTYLRQNNITEDAVFFSLHKQFPFSDGGMLRIINKDMGALSYSGCTEPEDNRNPWVYDTISISEKRRQNYKYLSEASEKYKDIFVPLKSLDSDFEVPQTFPIKLFNTDRFKVYLKMNEKGWGVVSLYHTLIEPLRNGEYPVSEALSECILNLPVHQDAESEKYSEMLSLLAEVCKKYSIT